MAIYIPSAIIGELRGSIGSTCFARNSTSTYARFKAVPTNPNTILQRTRRNNFTVLTSQWASVLTTAQRTAWNAYASLISWQNPLGQSVRISGFNHFMRLNTLKLLAGLVVQVAAPTISLLPPPPPSPPYAIATILPNLGVIFQAGEAWTTEVGAKLLVFASPGYSGSKSFLPKQFRYVGAVVGAATPPATPAVFTTLPFSYVATQKVLVYVRLVRLALGCTQPQYAENTWA